MTAIIATGSVALLFIILLFSPIVLRFEYAAGKMRGSVRYLFIRADFSPERIAERAEKKAEREIKKEYKKQKEEEGTKKKEEKAAVDTAKTVWSAVKACKRALRTLRRHMVFYKIRASIVAGGDEAYKIAKNYALACALAANLTAVLGSLFVVKKPKIRIAPGFAKGKTELDLALRARIAPFYVIAAGLQALTGFMRVWNKNKRKRKKIKGGKRNEPAASCQ